MWEVGRERWQVGEEGSETLVGGSSLGLGALFLPSWGPVLVSGMWGLLASGVEPVSPALAGGFFTTEPPGKP